MAGGDVDGMVVRGAHEGNVDAVDSEVAAGEIAEGAVAPEELGGNGQGAERRGGERSFKNVGGVEGGTVGDDDGAGEDVIGGEIAGVVIARDGQGGDIGNGPVGEAEHGGDAVAIEERAGIAGGAVDLGEREIGDGEIAGAKLEAVRHGDAAVGGDTGLGNSDADRDVAKLAADGPAGEIDNVSDVVADLEGVMAVEGEVGGAGATGRAGETDGAADGARGELKGAIGAAGAEADGAEVESIDSTEIDGGINDAAAVAAGAEVERAGSDGVRFGKVERGLADDDIGGDGAVGDGEGAGGVIIGKGAQAGQIGGEGVGRAQRGEGDGGRGCRQGAISDGNRVGADIGEQDAGDRLGITAEIEDGTGDAVRAVEAEDGGGGDGPGGGGIDGATVNGSGAGVAVGGGEGQGRGAGLGQATRSADGAGSAQGVVKSIIGESNAAGSDVRNQGNRAGLGGIIEGDRVGVRIKGGGGTVGPVEGGAVPVAADAAAPDDGAEDGGDGAGGDLEIDALIGGVINQSTGVAGREGKGEAGIGVGAGEVADERIGDAAAGVADRVEGDGGRAGDGDIGGDDIRQAGIANQMDGGGGQVKAGEGQGRGTDGIGDAELAGIDVDGADDAGRERGGEVDGAGVHGAVGDVQAGLGKAEGVGEIGVGIDAERERIINVDDGGAGDVDGGGGAVGVVVGADDGGVEIIHAKGAGTEGKGAKGVAGAGGAELTAGHDASADLGINGAGAEVERAGGGAAGAALVGVVTEDEGVDAGGRIAAQIERGAGESGVEFDGAGGFGAADGDGVSVEGVRLAEIKGAGIARVREGIGDVQAGDYIDGRGGGAGESDHVGAREVKDAAEVVAGSDGRGRVAGDAEAGDGEIEIGEAGKIEGGAGTGSGGALLNLHLGAGVGRDDGKCAAGAGDGGIHQLAYAVIGQGADHEEVGVGAIGNRQRVAGVDQGGMVADDVGILDAKDSVVGINDIVDVGDGAGDTGVGELKGGGGAGGAAGPVRAEGPVGIAGVGAGAVPSNLGLGGKGSGGEQNREGGEQPETTG